MLTRGQIIRYLLVVVLILGAVLAWSGQAKADGRIVINPDVQNADALHARFDRKVTGEDNITIWVALKDDVDQYKQWLATLNPGNTLILAYDNGDVYVRTDGWVPQDVANDLVDRVKNVNQGVGDRVVGIILALHDYQSSHPKPMPAPSPTAAPAPPAPPFDWSPYMIWFYIGVPLLVLFLLWLPLELRRRRRNSAYMRRAEEQADWGFSDYGIKSTID